MTRYIDADALLKELKKSCEYHAENSRELSLLQRDIIIVQEQPTVDAVPVRHGKWIRKTDTRFGEMLNDILICSECHIAFSTVTMIRRSYCPNCGAKMDIKVYDD